MDKDLLHTQGIGHQAGVLPAGAAEAAQHIFRDVIAALDRDLFDRIGHVFNGDGQIAFGDGLHRHGLPARGFYLGCQGGEFFGHRIAAQRLVTVGAEHLGEIVRVQLAQHDVAIGHRQGTAASVAGRARVGAGGIRTNGKAAAVVVQDRPAAGGHGVDMHHRRPHADARDLALEGPFEIACIMRYVRRRPAHVKADNLFEAGHGGGAHGADYAARWPGQNAVLALKQAGVGQTAVGLHEHQAGIAKFGGDLVHIAAQDR